MCVEITVRPPMSIAGVSAAGSPLLVSDDAFLSGTHFDFQKQGAFFESLEQEYSRLGSILSLGPRITPPPPPPTALFCKRRFEIPKQPEAFKHKP